MDYDTVYLSPHLDDVALSCGGRVAQQTRAGKRILMVTLMTADAPPLLSPFAQRFHLMCALGGDAMTIRREEDFKAADILGVEIQHGDLLDAVYRGDGDESFYPSHRAVLGRIHPDDLACAEQIGQILHDLPEHRERVVPLAVGNHVDHQLVRRLAEERWGGDLLYYEDFPYAMKWMAAWRMTTPRSEWIAVREPLTEDAVQTRIRSIAAYPTQLGMLFGKADRMPDQVRRFTRSREGERYWRKRDEGKGLKDEV